MFRFMSNLIRRPENNESHDGAIYALHGRFIMPAPKAMGEKETGRGAKLAIGILSGILVLAILLGATYLSIDWVKTPHHDAVSYLLGEDLEKAKLVLRDDPQPVEGQTGVYTIPGTHWYGAMRFDIRLYYENDVLMAVEYQTNFVANEKAAARRLSRVSHCLTELLPELEHQQVLGLDRGLLEEYFSEGVFQAMGNWQINAYSGSPTEGVDCDLHIAFDYTPNDGQGQILIRYSVIQ